MRLRPVLASVDGDADAAAGQGQERLQEEPIACYLPAPSGSLRVEPYIWCAKTARRKVRSFAFHSFSLILNGATDVITASMRAAMPHVWLLEASQPIS